MREFDEVYTAPHFGFKNASDYYHRASAMRVIDRMRVPARIITAEDDPFVPTAPFRDATVTSNPNLDVIITRTAGTARSLTDARDGSDGYWAEHEILAFATAHTSRLSQERSVNAVRRASVRLKPDTTLTKARAATSAASQTPAQAPALRA